MRIPQRIILCHIQLQRICDLSEAKRNNAINLVVLGRHARRLVAFGCLFEWRHLLTIWDALRVCRYYMYMQSLRWHKHGTGGSRVVPYMRKARAAYAWSMRNTGLIVCCLSQRWPTSWAGMSNIALDRNGSGNSSADCFGQRHLNRGAN